MAPYSPPTAGRAGKLRLDFNENTVGCSPAVVEAITALTAERLSIYPEYEATRAALSQFYGVPEEQFLLTNGTDEAIQVLVNTFVDDNQEVIVLQPSYAMYRFYAEVAGARVIDLPYRPADLAFPLEELLARISIATRAILIANPNNPTGTLIGIEAIEAILRHAPHSAVLIDEAYCEFCGVTALPLVARHQNLFVSRTFSKAYGLAGLRIGCLFSQTENVAIPAQSTVALQREHSGSDRGPGRGERRRLCRKLRAPGRGSTRLALRRLRKTRHRLLREPRQLRSFSRRREIHFHSRRAA